MALIHEIKNGKKSRDTAPLTNYNLSSIPIYKAHTVIYRDFPFTTDRYLTCQNMKKLNRTVQNFAASTPCLEQNQRIYCFQIS